MDEAIHKTHKAHQKVYSLFTGKRSSLDFATICLLFPGTILGLPFQHATYWVYRYKLGCGFMPTTQGIKSQELANTPVYRGVFIYMFEYAIMPQLFLCYLSSMSLFLDISL